MIKKEELRINNTVRFESRNVHITGFDTTEDRVITNESGYNMPYFDEIHPIPLTKELLIERGFSGSSSTSCWADIGDVYFQWGNDWKLLIGEVDGDIEDVFTIPYKVEFLHQIENIVYYNTGKELTKAATA